MFESDLDNVAAVLVDRRDERAEELVDDHTKLLCAVAL